MTDIPENQVIDFEISKAHLEATGWSLNQFERSNPFDCHAVYVYDFRFQTPELFTFPINDRIVEQPAQVLATVLEQWMKKRHRKKLKGRERRALPGVIADYVKASQSYRAWLTRKSANDRMHAFIDLPPVFNPTAP